MNIQLNETQKILVEENKGLVFYVVDKYFRNNFVYMEREELIAEGLYWLCKCAYFYDESKGVKFSSFAVVCIKKHLADYLQRFYKKRVDTVELEEYKDAGYYDKYEEDITEDLKAFLKKYLPEKKYQMAIDYYYNGMDWEEIAKKYGYVNRKAACAVFRETLAEKITNNDYLRKKAFEMFR